MTATSETGFPHLRADLARVRQTMVSAVSMGEPRMHEPCGHLVRNAGRLFRPTLALTSAYPFTVAGPADERVITAAAVVELLHIATLYHDDLCDEASSRRGQPTVNALYGDTVALLAGDYMLACCTELAAGLGPAAMTLVTGTLKALCAGQLRETVDLYDQTRTEQAYFESISGKTAKLMSASAAFGAMQAGATPEQQKIMGSYGHHLGLAFQIWDDLLDLWSAGDTGKPRLADLTNGVYTLPVIYGLAEKPAELSALLRQGPLSATRAAEVVGLLDETDARARTLEVAGGHIRTALAAIAELGDTAHTFLPRLVEVARTLMPEVEQLLVAAVSAAGSESVAGAAEGTMG